MTRVAGQHMVSRDGGPYLFYVEGREYIADRELACHIAYAESREHEPHMWLLKDPLEALMCFGDYNRDGTKRRSVWFVKMP